MKVKQPSRRPYKRKLRQINRLYKDISILRRRIAVSRMSGTILPGSLKEDKKRINPVYFIHRIRQWQHLSVLPEKERIVNIYKNIFKHYVYGKK